MPLDQMAGAPHDSEEFGAIGFLPVTLIEYATNDRSDGSNENATRGIVK